MPSVNRKIKTIAGIALFCALTSYTFGYSLTGTSWQAETAHYSLDSSNSEYDAPFIEAMQKWNGFSDFDFTYDTTGSFDPCTGGAGGSPDGRNSWRFSLDNCGAGWGGSTLAITTTWSSGGDNTDTDIVFNDSVFEWAVHDGNLSNDNMDFRRVAVHELGHALGLGHEEVLTSIMFPSISNTILIPQADDINGMRAIYGGSGNGNDFFMQNSSLSSISVQPGNTTFAETEQHYTGSSSTTLNPIVGYYLSSNTTLGSSDVFLASDESSLNISDTADDETATITVPSSTVPGAYFILFVADHDDRYSENNESNNTQAVAITIAIQRRTLSVSVSGSGSVTSSPSGINCPADCSQQYNEDTSVSLTPQASAGWRFKEWSGACSGSGVCDVSMSSSKSVSAVFVKGVVIPPILLLLLLDDG